MKKILILGGSRYILPVIESIHRLGYYAITCDYLPDNIAHKFSDEYHNVSIVDKEAILQLAQELNVDGVMSFACDPGVVTAAYVAEKMGLPGLPYASVEILQNKDKFRKFLTDNGFNVPKSKGYSDVDACLADVDFFSWPVIVKPTDSAGSKGVTKVEKHEMLKAAAQFAIEHSISGRYIIEEFIQQKGFSSDTDSFSINGKLVFTSFANQMFDKDATNPYTPAAYSWPSQMPAEIQSTLRSELQRLVTLLNLGTSIYNIETRQGTDGLPYIMEVSPRGGGNRLSEMLRYATGTDLVTNAVRAAVGDPIDGITGDPVYDGSWSEVILHSDTTGRFKELWIGESIADCVIEKDLWVNPGDEVETFTGANKAIGTLVLRFENQETMLDRMGNLRKYVKVITE